MSFGYAQEPKEKIKNGKLKSMARISIAIKDTRYMLGGMANKGKIVAHTAGVTAIRDAFYKERLQPVGAADVDEDWLAVNTLKTDGVYSIDRDNKINSVVNPDLRNNIVLRVPEAEAVIEIIGAKIDITQENTVVRTPVNRRSGTVKEYVQGNDYRVQVKGDLIRDSKEKYPVKAMKKLIEVLSQPTVIYCSNVKLRFFGIDRLVYLKGDFPHGRYVNVQPFQLDFLSDFDYGFLIEDI